MECGAIPLPDTVIEALKPDVDEAEDVHRFTGWRVMKRKKRLCAGFAAWKRAG